MVLLSTSGKFGTWGHCCLKEFLMVFEFKFWKYPRYASIYPYCCPASGNCKEVSDKFILILIFLTDPRESLNMWPSFYFWNIMALILFLFQFCLIQTGDWTLLPNVVQYWKNIGIKAETEIFSKSKEIKRKSRFCCHNLLIYTILFYYPLSCENLECFRL